MILDTSVIVAILFQESDAQELSDIIGGADVCRMSVASRLELEMVLDRQARPVTAREAELLLLVIGVVEEPVTLQQGLLAREAFHSYGRGRHPAKLNFGDCFAYALAKALDEPLLFKGNDFAKTDVRQARRG